MDKHSLISMADVEHVAKLAHLRFTDEEAMDCREKLGSILAYMQELQNIDTSGVKPTTHVLDLVNVFREDRIKEGLTRDQVLAGAPERTADSFKVPKVL